MAKFPSENPLPVMRIAGDGTVLYANPASVELLAECCPVGGRADRRWRRLVSESLKAGLASETEVELGARVYSFSVVPAVESGYVNLYAWDITKRKQAERALRTSRERLRRLARHLQSVREEERTRLARKMHDDLGHALTALKLDLAWVDRRLAEAGGSPQTRVRTRLASMSELADEAIRTVRDTVSELRPGILDDAGLAAALEWEARRFEDRTGMKCVFSGPTEEVPLGRRRSTALFRICQELLTNVALHAGATAVEVDLQARRDRLRLEVRDNGRGISPEQSSSARSLGILGMRERALLVGGGFSITGQAGEGTTAAASVPLDEPGKSAGPVR